MRLLQFIFLVMVFLAVRRLWRNMAGPRRPAQGGTRPGGSDGKPLRDLTQQDISDADYEDLP